MKIVEWYMDEGVSGRKLIKKRPELQRMIQDAEQGKFERIIFIKLDRFFRSVAEYHECMKRIAPVLWSTTEEEYDLTTANGRMLVNMKLTIAEMEADQTGERINIVNEYKLSTGQPLTGSMPFGFKIVTDVQTGRKKVVKDPDVEGILHDIIEYYRKFQSKRKTLLYLHQKYHIFMHYNTLSLLFKNTMLYGAYRDNPTYCEAYITKAEYELLQEISKRNVKRNTAENRAYLFSGLLLCPECGKKLKGNVFISDKMKKSGIRHRYKRYRCAKNNINHSCSFGKVISEGVIERMLLENIEQKLEDAKIRNIEVKDGESVKIPTYNIDEINEEIDRLNYSWRTKKIRTLEQYEADFEELMKKLELAEQEQRQVPVKDFSKIEAILSDGWKDTYTALDDEHKKAFWRSFISSIELCWTTEKREISKVNFF